MPIKNIQIFGTPKCFDTKKAQRYFSERGIRVQMIDLREKAMSQGEFDSVMAAAGTPDALLNEKAKDKEAVTLFHYLTEEAKREKLFENQLLLKTPIVRNGRQAAIGYVPQVWKQWESEK